MILLYEAADTFLRRKLCQVKGLAESAVKAERRWTYEGPRFSR